jgi:hypothetical protein
MFIKKWGVVYESLDFGSPEDTSPQGLIYTPLSFL